jgi:hypothetical protein
MTFEEEALQNLEEFQEFYLNREPRLPFSRKFESLYVSLTEIVLKQQKEINELREYVEEQKELEKEREADNYHKYQMSLSDFT